MNWKIKKTSNIVIVIASQKNKLKNIYIDFYVQIGNIKKTVLINKNTQINCINNILTKK